MEFAGFTAIVMVASKSQNYFQIVILMHFIDDRPVFDQSRHYVARNGHGISCIRAQHIFQLAVHLRL
jgi:hypothetical protein